MEEMVMVGGGWKMLLLVVGELAVGVVCLFCFVCFVVLLFCCFVLLLLLLVVVVLLLLLLLLCCV